MTDLMDRLTAALSDRYTIERELGRGGMAVVYLAHDQKLGRDVALKVLRPELAASLGSERFLREIEIAAKLTHPNILALYDCGEADGQLYYTMPYVEGESLRDRLNREKQLPVDDALQITREVADALGFAHSLGIVHRDIKPENILFTAGHAVVSDFGIARAVNEAGAETLTETGLAVGTPAYMSPEQAAGSKDVDGRTDLYSLACVLYEMLGGEPPYVGYTPQVVLAKKLSEPTPRISVIRDRVPAGVEDALDRALARTPADRFSTAAEFVEVLTAPVIPGAGHVAGDRRRASLRQIVVWLVGVVGVGVLLTAVIRGPAGPTDDPAEGTIRLAVLPCANRTGDSTQDYMAEAVRDEILNGLAGIATVEVRGRSSVMRYTDTAVSYPEIARELGVGNVVECTLYQAGDSVTVSAFLLDAPRDLQLWSQRYERPVAEVFDLGGDVALGVAEALQADVTPSESARIEAQPSLSQEALTHYHRGRHFTSLWTEEGTRRGIEHFEQAIELDSGFASAYVGLAEALVVRGEGPGDIRPVEYMPRVRALVLRALDLDPDLADAHRMFGYIKYMYDYDYEAGERETRLATELDPTSAKAWNFFGLALSAMGRDEEAIVASQRSVELDPVAPLMLSDYCLILTMARRYEEALAAATTAIELDPDFWLAYANAGDVSLLLGNREQAIRLYEQVHREENPPPLLLGMFGSMLGFVGNREAALRILDELLEMRSRRYVAPRVLGVVYVGLDSLDAAMNWYILAAETRDPGVNLLDIRRPFNDRLRDHPRYPELLRLLRLEG